jgi:predicted small lipoprotein YifL
MISNQVKDKRAEEMKRVKSLLAMALALTSLAGCGLKGPLYFPPANQPKTQTPQQAEQQKKQQQQRAAQADTRGLVSGGNASMSAE